MATETVRTRTRKAGHYRPQVARTAPRRRRAVSLLSNEELRWVRPQEAIRNRQELGQFVGISSATVGSKGISLSTIVIPPGGRAQPHVHQVYETAIYVLQGRVQTYYGPGLTRTVINESGDFIFIPAGVPHQPVNLSQDSPAIAIVARNDPNELENVRLYDPQTRSIRE